MTTTALPTEERFTLRHASWQQYEALRAQLDETGQRAFVTYDSGRMELMRPSRQHDKSGELLGRLVRIIAQVCDVEFDEGGSMTFKRRDLEKGLEPDKCFWVRNSDKVCGVAEIDLRRDTPPDIVIEVEISRRLLDRKAIYERMGVPELWLYDGSAFRILRLDAHGHYQTSSGSGEFPGLSFDGVPQLLAEGHVMRGLAWERCAVEWARAHLTKK
jgi:Uma2 family endonuclease